MLSLLAGTVEENLVHPKIKVPCPFSVTNGFPLLVILLGQTAQCHHPGPESVLRLTPRGHPGGSGRKTLDKMETHRERHFSNSESEILTLLIPSGIKSLFSDTKSKIKRL